MNLTWIERADYWHQAELGRVVLIVVRVGSRWSARVGAVIEKDRSELLYEREAASCDEAKREAESTLVENLSTVLERVAERARNHAIEQCAATVRRVWQDCELFSAEDAALKIRARILALST